MSAIKSSNYSEKYKESEINKLYKEMMKLIEKTLKAIDKAYNDGRIEIEDYDEMT